jgi:hypothetical protein
LTLLEMMKAAAAKHDFRPLGAEDPAQYREALIRHVRSRDFAAAHELRVGRAQADWTVEDVAAFRAFCEALPGPRTEPLDAAAIPMMETGQFSGPLSDEMMFAIADRMLKWFQKTRRADPQKEFRPMIDLLLMDGRTLATEVNRGERVAVLKTLAQHLPVYGFVLGFDGWAHMIETNNSKAEKLDAIIIHIGTRDLRVAKICTYRYRPNGTVVFDEPKPDMNMRGAGTSDPYAGVFVSVPTSTTRQ